VFTVKLTTLKFKSFTRTGEPPVSQFPNGDMILTSFLALAMVVAS